MEDTADRKRNSMRGMLNDLGARASGLAESAERIESTLTGHVAEGQKVAPEGSSVVALLSEIERNLVRTEFSLTRVYSEINE